MSVVEGLLDSEEARRTPMIALMGLRGELVIVGMDARLVRYAQRLDDRAWRRRVRRGMDSFKASSPDTLAEVLHRAMMSARIP